MLFPEQIKEKKDARAGPCFEVIKRVETLAAENGIRHVQKVVLAIGESSSVVPMFIREVYPSACEDTVLEGSELEIETIPAPGQMPKLPPGL